MKQIFLKIYFYQFYFGNTIQIYDSLKSTREASRNIRFLSTSHMNHIFKQIFSDLSWKPNLSRKRNKAHCDVKLLETYSSWSTSHMNHIFKQIFSDLSWKPNLLRKRNKARSDVVPTCQDILSNILLEHLIN